MSFFCAQTLQAGGGLIYAVVHGPDIHGRLSQGKLLCYSCKQKAKHVFPLPAVFYFFPCHNLKEGKSNQRFGFDSLSYCHRDY